MRKGDDGYVMFNNSLKINGTKILGRYQKAGYTINRELVSINSWDYYLNNQSMFEPGVWEKYSEDIQCNGTLTKLSSTDKETIYVAVWTDCNPKIDTLIMDNIGKRVTVTNFKKGQLHSYEYTLVE